MIWPPDYSQIFLERSNRLKEMRSNPNLIVGALEYYRTRPIEFINDWMVTYNPRNAGTGVPTIMPFILFPKQEELVDYLYALLIDQENGLVEKSRDMGATWVCCAVSVHLWLFWDGSATGWGSRKSDLVDRLGDPDSIFEKIRMIIRYLPNEFLPRGFSLKDNSSWMKVLNPDTGASITGEAGDNIGRGGRKLIYFKDESAHYERPDLIEASLGDNTNCQVDISSVNGTGNVFYRRRQYGEIWSRGCEIKPGKTRIFIMDWRDHPAKDQEWYDRRKQKADDDGLTAKFAQEVDRDYASSVEGILIPNTWVKSCLDAHLKIDMESSGTIFSALDVADEGGDKNAQATRQGCILNGLEMWGEGDTGQTAQRAISTCRVLKVGTMFYDCIGVGAGVKAETNRIARESGMPAGLKIVPWDAGAGVQGGKHERLIKGDRDSPLIHDFFKNMKAQAWWAMRERCRKTHMAVTEGVEFEPDELMSIDSRLPLAQQLANELSQPTKKYTDSGKLMIDKKPKGSSSPNLADAAVMAFFPVNQGGFFAV